MKRVVAGSMVLTALAAIALGVHQRQVRQACPTGEPLCGHYAAQRFAELAGRSLSLSEALREMPAAVEGNSLEEIRRLLQRAGVPAEHRRVQLEQLQARDFPVLAHLSMPDHFVVLLGRVEDGYDVFDAHGERRVYGTQAVRDRWSGNVLVLAAGRSGPRRAKAPARRTAAAQQAGDQAAQQAEEQIAVLPRVEFEYLTADVGTVYQSQKGVVATYRVRNAGGQPLLLWPAGGGDAGQGMPRWKLPKGPIEPGKSARISVVFDVPPVLPSFVRSFYIRTNDPLRRAVRLTVSGIVKQPFRLEPGYLDLGELVVGVTQRRALFFTADVEDLPELETSCTLRGAMVSVFLLDDADRATRWWPVPGQAPQTRSAVKVIELAYTPAQAGPISGELVVRAVGDIPFERTVRLRGHASEPIVATPGVFFFGEVLPDRSYQQTVIVSARGQDTVELQALRRPSGLVLTQTPRTQEARQFTLKLRGRGRNLVAAGGANVEIDVYLPQQNRTVTLMVPVYARDGGAQVRR